MVSGQHEYHIYYLNTWNILQENRRNGNFDLARHGWISDYNAPINMLDM